MHDVHAHLTLQEERVRAALDLRRPDLADRAARRRRLARQQAAARARLARLVLS